MLDNYILEDELEKFKEVGVIQIYVKEEESVVVIVDDDFEGSCLILELEVFDLLVNKLGFNQDVVVSVTKSCSYITEDYVRIY